MTDHPHSTRRLITEGCSGTIVDHNHLYLNGALRKRALDGPEGQLAAVSRGDDHCDLGACGSALDLQAAPTQ